MEVSSGEWSPGTVKYVQAPQRALLKSLGFAIGGKAKNFAKTLPVLDVASAGNAARQTMRIFFEAFGFRGQWPLEIRAESGARAELDWVYQALTPDDLAKLMAECGCAVSVATDEGGGPVLLAQRARQRFTVTFDWQEPGESLYRLAMLDALIPAPVPPTDATLARVSQELVGITVTRHESGDVRLTLPLRFDGGVTAAWIASGLEGWFTSITRARRLLRPVAVRKRRARSGHVPAVH